MTQMASCWVCEESGGIDQKSRQTLSGQSFTVPSCPSRGVDDAIPPTTSLGGSAHRWQILLSLSTLTLHFVVIGTGQQAIGHNSSWPVGAGICSFLV
jgi:hypothetical protein